MAKPHGAALVRPQPLIAVRNLEAGADWHCELLGVESMREAPTFDPASGMDRAWTRLLSELDDGTETHT